MSSWPPGAAWCWCVAALLGLGLLVVPWVFRSIVALRRKETLLVTSVGFCFALALFAQSQGLSVALGAFLAGALISEAGVSRHVEPLVEPLRDMFTGIFFVSIGMLFDPAGRAARLAPHRRADARGAWWASRSASPWASFLSGQPVRTAVQAGMSLTQIGEFSFVIATIGAGLSAGAGRLFSVAVAVAMLTAFTTPLLMGRSERFALYVDARLPRRAADLRVALRLLAGTAAAAARRLGLVPGATRARSCSCSMPPPSLASSSPPQSTSRRSRPYLVRPVPARARRRRRRSSSSVLRSSRCRSPS